MPSKTPFSYVLLTTGLLAAALPVQAHAAMEEVNPNEYAAVTTNLPQPQTEGNVTYITGGFGDEERIAIEQSRKNYNLYITHADFDGAYTGKVSILILNSDGEAVVHADSGPLFNARLMPGRYTIEARMDGQNITRNITIVRGKSQTLDLKWRAE